MNQVSTFFTQTAFKEVTCDLHITKCSTQFSVFFGFSLVLEIAHVLAGFQGIGLGSKYLRCSGGLSTLLLGANAATDIR